MNVRATGIAMVIVGAVAQGVGLVIDVVRHRDDAAAAQRAFDLSVPSHALFFGGLAVAVLGLLLLLVGPALYRQGATVTAGRHVLQVGAPLAAVAFIAGCAAVANDTTRAQPAAADAALADAGGHDHGAGASDTHDHGSGATAGATAGGHDHGAGVTPAAADDHGDVIAGTADGTSPCEVALPMPSSPGQVGTGEGGSSVDGAHGHRGMVRQEPLTRAEREQLADEMEQARQVAKKYPTVKDAEAAGYHMSTVYVPCIGAHYTNTAYAARFDPALPSELLYDGTDPDSRMVGLSYLVWNPGGPPEGFAGPNDRWHQHNSNGGLCLQGGVVVGGEADSPEECEAKGGRKTVLRDIWMAHAWVAPGFECTWGVFAGECPELGGKVGGSAWDEPVPDDDDLAGQG